MKDYELVYILKTATADEKKAEIQSKIEEIIKTDGEITSVDVWGNKKLAYQIQKLSDGYYVLVNFKANAEIPKELDRNLKIMDECMRHMIINVTDNK